MYRIYILIVVLLLCLSSSVGADAELLRQECAKHLVVRNQQKTGSGKVLVPRKKLVRVSTSVPHETRTPRPPSGMSVQPLALKLFPVGLLVHDFSRLPLSGQTLLWGEDQTPFFTARENLLQTQEHETRLAASISHASTFPLAYQYAVDKKTNTSLHAGVAWIDDLADSRRIVKTVWERTGNEDSPNNKVPGVNLKLGASYKALAVTGGYIRALENRPPLDLALDSKEGSPMIWNSEVAYSMELLRRETTLAVGYQKTSDALLSYLPEERYKTRASVALSNATVLSFEYYQDREFGAKNKTGEEGGYGISTKFGIGF